MTKRKTSKEQFVELLKENNISLNDFFVLKALWEELSADDISKIIDDERAF